MVGPNDGGVIDREERDARPLGQMGLTMEVERTESQLAQARARIAELELGLCLMFEAAKTHMPQEEYEEVFLMNKHTIKARALLEKLE